MPYKIDIYIGSDNGSHKIHDDYLSKIHNWANQNFPDGYTLLRGQGCYRGSSEDSLLIDVLSEYDVSVRNELEQLKRELQQESILLVKTSVDLEIIQ